MGDAGGLAAGRAAFKRGAWAEAEVEFTGALAQAPAAPDAGPLRLCRSLARYRLGDFPGALADARAALDLGAPAVKAAYRAGACLLELRRPAEALAYFERAQAADPGHPGLAEAAAVARATLRAAFRRARLATGGPGGGGGAGAARAEATEAARRRVEAEEREAEDRRVARQQRRKEAERWLERERREREAAEAPPPPPVPEAAEARVPADGHRELLGIAAGASKAEVRRAYLRKLKELHPDKAGGTKAAFLRLQAAFAALKDGGGDAPAGPGGGRREDAAAGDNEGADDEPLNAVRHSAEMWRQCVDCLHAGRGGAGAQDRAEALSMALSYLNACDDLDAGRRARVRDLVLVCRAAALLDAGEAGRARFDAERVGAACERGELEGRAAALLAEGVLERGGEGEEEEG